MTVSYKLSIENALGALAAIIDSEADENSFQQWFEHNPIIFRCLGYKSVIAHPHLTNEISGGEEYIPDFMAINSAGMWEIVEIKPAKMLIMKDSSRRRTLRAATESYISQCAEYSGLFMDKSYRDEFNKKYLADCHKTPEIALIMGRDVGLDKAVLHEVLSRRASPHIKIITYDDVRGYLRNFLETAGDSPTGVAPGLGVFFNAILHRGEVGDTNYVVDICKKGGNSRIQIYMENLKVHLVITDATGVSYKYSTTEDDCRGVLERFALFSLQILENDDDMCVSFSVNEVVIFEVRQRSFDFDFAFDLDFVVGSDQTGRYASNMHFGVFIVIPLLPAPEDMWFIKRAIYENKNEKGESYLLEFVGYKYLHTPSHPFLGRDVPFSSCLIQEDKEKKPILRAMLVA